MSDDKKVGVVVPVCVLTVTDAETKEQVEWTFQRCVQWVVDTCGRFNQTGPGIRQGKSIVDAVDGVAVGEPVMLKRDDAKSLLEALNAPEHGFHPPWTAPGRPAVPARMFLPYLDAVEAALKE